MSGGGTERKVVLTLPLTNPIVMGSETVEELEFREMTAGDLFGHTLRALTIDMDVASLMRLAARLAGQPEGTIKRLCGTDLGEVLKAVSGFIEALLPSGPTGSSESQS